MNWGESKRSHGRPAPQVPMQQHKLNQHRQIIDQYWDLKSLVKTEETEDHQDT